MENKCLTASFLLAAAAIYAFGGGRKTSTPATIDVSCQACTVGEAISYIGSGYKPNTAVTVAIDGPTSYAITAKSDGSGNISIDYGTTLTYAPGDYNVTAMVPAGKSLNPVATDSFSVE